MSVNSTGNGTGNGTSTTHEDEGHIKGIAKQIPFILFAMAMGAALRNLLRVWPKSVPKPPYTVFVFCVAVLFAFLADAINGPGIGTLGDSIGAWQLIDNNVILLVMLPPLLYESGVNMNPHVFRKVALSSLILAFPGVVITLVVIAGLSYVTFDYGWNFETCLLLGAILSATDPIAVVACLQSLGAPKSLSTLVEGESLLNDGSGFVVFLCFIDLAKGNAQSVGEGILLFIKLAFGSYGWGTLCGVLTYAWVKLVYNDPFIEITLIMVANYACYYVGEVVFHLSGVLSVVCFSIFMSARGKFALSKHSEHAHHSFLSQLCFISNTFVFALAGVIVYSVCFSEGGPGYRGLNWLLTLALYGIIHVARGATVLSCWPFLSRLGYGATWKEVFIMWFSGLRGMLGLVLALVVLADNGLKREIRAQIAFHVAGQVILTTLVNGASAGVVYDKLHVYKVNSYRPVLIKQAMFHMQEQLESLVTTLRDDWFYRHASWNVVADLLPNFKMARVDEAHVDISLGSAGKLLARIGSREPSKAVAAAEESAAFSRALETRKSFDKPMERFAKDAAAASVPVPSFAAAAAAAAADAAADAAAAPASSPDGHHPQHADAHGHGHGHHAGGTGIFHAKTHTEEHLLHAQQWRASTRSLAVHMSLKSSESGPDGKGKFLEELSPVPSSPKPAPSPKRPASPKISPISAPEGSSPVPAAAQAIVLEESASRARSGSGRLGQMIKRATDAGDVAPEVGVDGEAEDDKVSVDGPGGDLESVGESVYSSDIGAVASPQKQQQRADRRALMMATMFNALRAHMREQHESDEIGEASLLMLSDSLDEADEAVGQCESPIDVFWKSIMRHISVPRALERMALMPVVRVASNLYLFDHLKAATETLRAVIHMVEMVRRDEDLAPAIGHRNRHELRQLQNDARSFLRVLRADFPEKMAFVYTILATKVVLQCRREQIMQLYAMGVLDDGVRDELLSSVEERLFSVNVFHPPSLSLADEKDFVRQRSERRERRSPGVSPQTSISKRASQQSEVELTEHK